MDNNADQRPQDHRNNNHDAPPEHRRIQDLDGWLQVNGLVAPRQDVANNESSPISLQQREQGWKEHSENVALWEERKKFQESVHAKLFADFDHEQCNIHQKRTEIIHNNCNDSTMIEILLASSDDSNDNDSVVVPIKPLAESCETIFALLTSSFAANTIDSIKKCNTNTNYICQEQQKHFRFSLKDYPAKAVHEFMSVVVGNLETSTKTKKNSYTKQNVYDIQDEYVIDCFRIADYLQNESIRNEINTILVSSIDDSNCLYLCSIADELNLNELFEKSMIHLLNTIGSIENMDNGENVWGHSIHSSDNKNDENISSSSKDDNDGKLFMTPELKERIILIKRAIESSIHSQRNQIYVSSLQEYIAIFAERVQYYTERLQQAKDDLLVCSDLTPGTYNYEYVQEKICKQERRVHTFRSALQQQKAIFLGSGLDRKRKN